MGGPEPCEFSMFGVLFWKHRAEAENRMFFCFFYKMQFIKVQHVL